MEDGWLHQRSHSTGGMLLDEVAGRRDMPSDIFTMSLKDQISSFLGSGGEWRDGELDVNY
jgi:hypothetical protein